MENVVTFKNVSKLFEEQIAVEELNFSIASGEFFSLLGPSGCGKTTTLRLIGGFEQPSKGSIMIEGADVSGVPPYLRNVNTVFQSYALFPHLNVYENVAFGLRRKGTEPGKLAEEVERSLELVRLTGFEKRKIQQLSGGQQQRVALARALVNQPSVLLLDEPMAALDSQLKREMRAELKRLQRRLGITFVLVTHDQEEALTMSDRVAVLSEGKVQQVSPPEELYRHPQNAFVANFIGRANLLPVNYRAKQLWFQDQRLAIKAGVTEGEYQWMLRPEALHIGRHQEDDNSVQGELVESVFVGPIVRHKISLGQELVLTIEESSSSGQTHDLGTIEVGWSSKSGTLLPQGAKD